MSVVTKRAIGEVLLSVSTLCVLAFLLVSFNEPLHQEFALRMSAGQPAAQAANAQATILNLASIVFVAARDQSIEHAPLVIFVLAAVVLFGFMLRT